MKRREFLTGLLLTGVAPSALAAPAHAYELTLSDAEWRKRLSPAAYNVLRHAGTEAPDSSPLLKEHRKGIFSCAGCGLDNFSSTTKFESHTGWPSFWQPPAPRRHLRRGHQPGRTAHRSALPALRRPSGTRLSRRTQADRAPLLHERCCLKIQDGLI